MVMVRSVRYGGLNRRIKSAARLVYRRRRGRGRRSRPTASAPPTGPPNGVRRRGRDLAQVHVAAQEKGAARAVLGEEAEETVFGDWEVAPINYEWPKGCFARHPQLAITSI